jgi:carboxymethylenebutenolidase
MKTEMMTIKTADGNCEAFVAKPDDGKPHPAVVMFMDAFGPRPVMYQMAARLAREGYHALLPNLFYRKKALPLVNVANLGTQEGHGAEIQTLMPLLNEYNPEMMLRDAGAFLSYLSSSAEVLQEPVSVVGYCFGGSVALRTAAAFPDRVKAAVSLHAGRLATDQPNSVHLLAPKIKARVFLGHADQDKSMPPEQIAQLTQAFDAAGVRYESELFEGAPHGWTMADLPAYRAESAERAWQKMMAVFGAAT